MEVSGLGGVWRSICLFISITTKGVLLKTIEGKTESSKTKSLLNIKRFGSILNGRGLSEESK